MMRISLKLLFIIACSLTTHAQVITPPSPPSPPSISEPIEINKYTLTLWLGAHNDIYSFIGKLEPDASNLTLSDYSSIRKVLRNFKRSIPVKDSSLVQVIIKPCEQTTFRNTIDIIDEMTIGGFKQYSKIDMSDEEYALTKVMYEQLSVNSNYSGSAQTKKRKASNLKKVRSKSTKRKVSKKKRSA
jgi:hypothetical protein